MIEVKRVDGNLFAVDVADVVENDNFAPLEAQIANQAARFGTIRSPVDGRSPGGWADIAAAHKQFSFIHRNAEKIEKLAVIAGGTWLQWAAKLTEGLIEGDVAVFEETNACAAATWVSA